MQNKLFRKKLQMKKTVTIQDFIDALGMEGLLTTIDGQQSCAVLMALYSDAELKEAAGRAVSGVTYNSLEAGEGSLFVCKGAHFREQYLKDAVLDNKVENEREPLMKLLMEKAQSMGLKIS